MASDEATVASRVPFHDLCKGVLEKVSTKQKAVVKKHFLERFIHMWREEHKKLHGDQHSDDSFYPAMRLILPSFDKERGAYGFKEHLLAKKLISLFCLGRDSPDAKALLSYRTPSGTAGSKGAVGDFALTAVSLLKVRLTQSSYSLTVQELNDRLDTIAVENANNNQAAVERELEMLCRKVTDLELKWLIRILLKQMKLGMAETSVLGQFHTEASQLYDVTTSLRQVCQQLHLTDTKLDVIQIRLFSPFRPMLANRVEPSDVPRIMNELPFFVEVKYDGERVQLHKDGDNYKYFSRNGNDFTKSYGASSTEGSLTPYIHRLFSPTVQKCILDAEMVGWNPQLKCIATKGEQFDVKSLKDGDELHPCLVVFDCLLLNEKILSADPLTTRLEALEQLFTKQEEGRCMLAERHVKSTSSELVDCLNLAIERREEGLVVKRPDSTYRLNERSNKAGWLKLKPDYIDSINDDLDLVIVGGYFGRGRRANMMSHFLLALAVAEQSDEDKTNSDPQRFATVCKVGSGYSLLELANLNQWLTQGDRCLLKRADKNTVPHWLDCASEKPDVFIDPTQSKVLQVRAAEIVPSGGSYALGYTLRFARVQKIRDDKSYEDATTTKQFMELCGKLTQRCLVVDNETKDESAAKKRRTTRVSNKPQLLDNMKGPTDIDSIERTGSLLRGKELCVMNCNAPGWSKEQLEREIISNRGRITQNPGHGTDYVLADTETVKVRNVVMGQQHNVVNTRWLIRSLDSDALVPWAPRDLLFAKEDVKCGFQSSYDRFGDSYTEDLESVEQLKALIDRMPVVADEKTDVSLHERYQELAEFESDNGLKYKYGLFRRCRVYSDRYYFLHNGSRGTALNSSPLELIECLTRLYGALLVESLQEATHVVVHSRDFCRMKVINGTNRTLSRKFHVVTEKWVRDCISRGELLSELPYRPVNCG